jgi:hypothetical protein
VQNICRPDPDVGKPNDKQEKGPFADPFASPLELLLVLLCDGRIAHQGQADACQDHKGGGCLAIKQLGNSFEPAFSLLAKHDAKVDDDHADHRKGPGYINADDSLFHF